MFLTAGQMLSALFYVVFPCHQPAVFPSFLVLTTVTTRSIFAFALDPLYLSEEL